jgi:hypothetical protein
MLAYIGIISYLCTRVKHQNITVMKLSEKFKNLFTYSQGVEKWCRKLYYEMTGNEMSYTFVSDMALEDFTGDTTKVDWIYNKIKKEWLKDYKAFTEVCISINLLAWANDKLSQQGIDDRDVFTNYYSELYYKARDEFYEYYKNDDEAKDYFFSMTD